MASDTDESREARDENNDESRESMSIYIPLLLPQLISIINLPDAPEDLLEETGIKHNVLMSISARRH